MAVFIIFVLLIIIWRMFENKKDTEDKENERLHPGYIENREKIRRINHKLDFIAEAQNKAIKNAVSNGKKISFWTHTYPKKQGYYQVKYQDNISDNRHDYDDLFYQGVLYPNEWGDYVYNDERVTPKLLTKTAYWDGIRYDVKNVRYYLFEIN
jgi:hypothetical protein